MNAALKKMTKNILMVYPKIPTTYWSFEYALSFVGDKSLMPPLGLITIAAMLPEEYRVKLVDLNIEELNDDDITNADMVFISAMIVQQESFTEVVKRCNELNKPVAAGGPYPTTSYEKIEGVDYFILNEGEITLPKFISDLENGTPQHIYTDETKPHMRETPVPRFDLLNVDAYSTMVVQSSRGCPFNCEFCDIIEMFGRVPRYKEPEQLLKEFEVFTGMGYIGPLFIVDDNFIGNKKKVKELLRSIVQWQKDHDFPFTLFTEASINLAQDEELLDLMVEAGFNMVFIGIETPDTSTLEVSNKQQNVRTNIHESVRLIQSKGIEVLAGFIVGFDTDPKDIFDMQINFIKEAAIPMAMIGIMMALPKTQLHRRLEKEGRLLGDTHGNNTHEMELNFTPVMPVEELVAGYKKVISEIYKPENYFNRCIELINRIPKQAFKSRVLQKNDLKALFKSLVKQTFSSYGFHYWKLLLTTIIRNRHNFTLAANLAIKGYHFFKITNEILEADSFNSRYKTALASVREEIAEIENSNLVTAIWDIKGHIKSLEKDLEKIYKKLSPVVKNQVKDTLLNFEASCQEEILKIVRPANLPQEELKEADAFSNSSSAGNTSEEAVYVS
ncbi:MAG: DUF4070 domain-containing protein [bacterium]|nr:DUF4070 domain-containing protein [bacterium]